MAFMGASPKRIPHYEHWSCPDAETHLTGIDYYDHPRLCRLKMLDLYPELNLPVPETDQPKPRPALTADGQSSSVDDEGKQHVRWGDSETTEWDWGSHFKTAEDVFTFSPLEADFRKIPVIESYDFSDEERLFQAIRKVYPAEWGDKTPDDQPRIVYWYNTMFMWPMLTFGWELFLETCLEPEFERLMDEFAELNRRAFRCLARMPAKFVVCHDDIVNARGPVCSPAWMEKYIFPRYEEFWDILKSSGKEVIFMADGCMDRYADDVFARGARGIITEPYTDFPTIARKHKDCVLAGEGDNRILTRNQPGEIRAMVEKMAATAQLTGGYLMCIGNHIPWNVPPDAIKRYLDLCNELGHR
jgi:hypothetical protein